MHKQTNSEDAIVADKGAILHIILRNEYSQQV